MASQQQEVQIRGVLVADKGTWAVRARITDPFTGVVHNRSKSTGFKVNKNTKRKAEQRMREIVAGWEKAANTYTIPQDPLFSEYVQAWLDKKKVTVNGNTHKSYCDYAEKHILPQLGKLKIKQMTLRQLQAFYIKLLKTHTVASCKKYHVVVMGALLDAVRDGIIPNNFAEYVEFPKAKHFEGQFYTRDEALRLLEAAKQEGEPMYTALILALFYGLRKSEICGLRWKDIDFDTGEMHIRNTVTKNGTLRIEREQTKTAKSRRDIQLAESTIPHLEQLKATQMESGLDLDKVCLEKDGRPISPDTITRRAAAIMKKSQLPVIRLHDLRHTSATLAATMLSPKQVQVFLGHEDISTTMDIYTHLLDDERRATSVAMNDILGDAISCSESCSE